MQISHIPKNEHSVTEQPSQSNIQIGDPVEHPQYGRGRVTALFRNGAEWMVQFESGLRFRRPRTEFAGQESVTLAPAAPMPMPDTLPMSRTQFEARQLVEALRVGVAPAQHIQELTIGLVEERATLSAGIVQALSLIHI